MIEIDKNVDGRVIKVKHIKMDKEDYDWITSINKHNCMRDAETHIAIKYRLTRTEAYKVMMAVQNNYKYLEVIN